MVQLIFSNITKISRYKFPNKRTFCDYRQVNIMHRNSANPQLLVNVIEYQRINTYLRYVANKNSTDIFTPFKKNTFST